MNKGFASADEYQTLKLASRLISILDMESTIRASVAQTAGGLATQIATSKLLENPDLMMEKLEPYLEERGYDPLGPSEWQPE